MKSTFILLFSSIVIIVKTSAQAAGDYRSTGNGNWNDASKWETYNGSNWVGAAAYPGQNTGTGVVTIMNGNEIKITGSLPHAISSLDISADLNQILPSGSLVFISENPVSLIVDGDVMVSGSISITDQNGAKSHSLTIGGSLVAGAWTYYEEIDGCDYGCLFYYCYSPYGGYIQTVNNDDKLAVIFNTTKPNSAIGGASTITFQDISFNGIGISVGTSIYINGTASFLNGIVNSCCGYCETSYCGYYWTPDTAPPPPPLIGCGSIRFNDGAIAMGASANSFVSGTVTKKGNDAFTFPLGYENQGALVPLTIYAPLTISAPVASQDEFYASYSRGQLYREISDDGLFSVSQCEYWYLNPGNQGQNVTTRLDVTAGWSPSSGCGSPYIANVPDVNLAHSNASTWDSHGGSGEGTTTNGSVTWRGVSNFGGFTLGNVNTSCLTPSALSATNIATNSATLNWSAAPGSASYDVLYKRTSDYGWSTAATAVTSTSLNLSSLTPLVTYDWKVRANCSSSSSIYKWGPQFTTQSPCGMPSRLTTTNITFSGATLSWDPVPNANSYNVEFKQSSSTTWQTPGAITSTTYSLGGLMPGIAYDWRVRANCSQFPSNYATASFTTATCNDVYETNNSSSQAKTINLGAAITANISSAADADWFKVTMPNSGTLNVTLYNLPGDYDLYVYNKNVMLVGSSTKWGISNETVSYNSHARSATYYIKVIGKNGAYDAVLCYNLLAQAVGSGGPVTRAANNFDEIADVSESPLLYPNPASEFVHLRFSSNVAGSSSIQVLNTVGQLVKQYPVNIVDGLNQFQIPLADMKPGMYILKITKDGLNILRKFAIARQRQ